MPRQPVPNKEIIKAMNKLFRAVGPFESELRNRARGVELDNNIPDVDGMLARMVELEKALCCINWSVLLLKGWKYQEGIGKERLEIKTRKNRLSLSQELEDLMETLQHIRLWGLAAKALEDSDAVAYMELVFKFKKVFSALKKNSAMSFVYGTSGYLEGSRGVGGLEHAIKGAWKGRSLIWSPVVTDHMDYYIADLEIFVEQLNARATARGVEEYFKGVWKSDADIEAYDDQEDIELELYDEKMEVVDDKEDLEVEEETHFEE